MLEKLQSSIEAGSECQMKLALAVLDKLDGGDLEDTLAALGGFSARQPRAFLAAVEQRRLDAGLIGSIVDALPENSVDDDPMKLRLVRERLAAIDAIQDAHLAAARATAVKALRDRERMLVERIREEARGCDQQTPHENWAACFFGCTACDCAARQAHADPRVMTPDAVTKLLSSVEAGFVCHLKLALAVLDDLNRPDREETMRVLANMSVKRPDAFLTALAEAQTNAQRLAEILRKMPMSVANDPKEQLRIVRERLRAIESFDEPEFRSVRSASLKALKEHERELAGR
jgi:hypothetical protein